MSDLFNFAEFDVGSHVGRRRTLAETILAAHEHLRGAPLQIFLSSPRGGGLRLADAELAAAAAAVAAVGARLYVHAPYTINLCRSAEAPPLLVATLRAAAAIGARGVVVHVGKSVGLANAAANMRASFAAAAAEATAQCPLLLETPAGQGTETLTGPDEFFGFVADANAVSASVSASASVSVSASVSASASASVSSSASSSASSSVGICVDTCHVFACGHDPVEYVKKAVATGLLRLVHFNDSQGACGSCVDRHASAGTGRIGAGPLREVAHVCRDAAIDMLVE